MGSYNGTYNGTISCAEKTSTGSLGVRISSVFVVGFGSLLGALVPIYLNRTKHAANKWMKHMFFMVKYFGSGVIIATAFIHLLAPAEETLYSECLSGLPISKYDFVSGIALMTIFVMFFIELMAARCDFTGGNKRQSEDSQATRYPAQLTERGCSPIAEMLHLKTGAIVRDELRSSDSSRAGMKEGRIELVDSAVPHPPGRNDHLGHQTEHDSDFETGLVSAQLTSIFILEFGVIFHSIFVGLTLAVNSEFVILYIVLAFHQTFEGLGLGTRLATTPWSKKQSKLPWVLGVAYGLTTPLAIAIGLGVRAHFSFGRAKAKIAEVVFDSISAGVLIYTGLIELMAHEFMFNEEMRKASLTTTMFAFGCMCTGAGLMALLGKWA